MALMDFIENQSEFFGSYKSKFIETLRIELENLNGNKEAFNLLKDKLNLFYEAFLNLESQILVERLKKIIYKALENGIPIRRILENAFIQLVKDYIEYQQKRGIINFEQIKSLIIVIEKYLQILQEVFKKYMEDLEEASKRKKEEAFTKTNEELLRKLRKLNPIVVNLITFYEDFPVICKTTVDRISSFVEVSSCNYKAFAPNTQVYLQIPKLSQCVLGVIINIHKNNFVIKPIKFEECPKTSPVKVFPKKEIDVKICKADTCVYGFLKNLSLEEIEILTKNAMDIVKGDEVELIFSLLSGKLEAKAVITGVTKLNSNFVISAKFIKDWKMDRIISEYIIKRQQEILKELRI